MLNCQRSSVQPHCTNFALLNLRYIIVFSIHVNGYRKGYQIEHQFWRNNNIALCSHHIDCCLCLFQGTSTKYSPQRVGLQHQMHDEDVIQIIKKWLEHKLINWQRYCPFFSTIIFHCANLSGSPIHWLLPQCYRCSMFNTRPSNLNLSLANTGIYCKWQIQDFKHLKMIELTSWLDSLNCSAV